jgi:8-amino-7-oxononanoate synthase
MQTRIFNRISFELEEIKAKGRLRRAPQHAALPVDLSTNSYLALELEPEVQAAATLLCAGCLSGNLASRLIASSTPLFEELERELAQWKNTESALIFNSGYAANTAALQALANRSTVVFCDRLNHASIIDGIILSGARLERYNHADAADLKQRLDRLNPAESIIVTDSVFSMDGDRAPLSDICDLGRRYGCLVMVDEAHAAGIFGRRLSGLVEHDGVEDGVHVRVGTMSKAVAGLGGFIASSKLIRDCLVNKGRSFIFSTALPHSVLAWDLAAVRWIKANPASGGDVLKNAALLREKIRLAGFDTLSGDTQIVPFITGSEQSALSLSSFLREAGIAAPAIRPPTVPAGMSRVRFSVNKALTPARIDEVCIALSTWKKCNG